MLTFSQLWFMTKHVPYAVVLNFLIQYFVVSDPVTVVVDDLLSFISFLL